jgi:hypothetical protein
MSQDIKNNLQNRSKRAEAVIEICQQRITSLLPDLANTVDKMTWAEISEITPYLSYLGTEAVETFCKLLNSSRKQTIECITTALAEIGDIRAVDPLIKMMEDQAGQSNALRARDALIELGEQAIPGLTSALASPKWEVRYYAVQALAVIGDPITLDALLDLIEEDRSNKVREAAEEALRFITYADYEKPYSTKAGLFNPLLASGGFYEPEWQVDIINMNYEAILWRFALDLFEENNFLSPELVLCRSILPAYQQIKDTSSPLDIIVLMGDFLDENQFASEFGVALITSEDQRHVALNLMNLAEKIFMSSTKSGSWEDPSAYWLGQTALMPLFHLNSEQDLRYDWDGSYKPNQVWQDSPQDYGTSLQFIAAKAALDQSWVYHDNLEILKERGIIKHIPQCRNIEHEG